MPMCYCKDYGREIEAAVGALVHITYDSLLSGQIHKIDERGIYVVLQAWYLPHNTTPHRENLLSRRIFSPSELVIYFPCPDPPGSSDKRYNADDYRTSGIS